MTIISKLKSIFGRFGIVMEIVADNIMPCGSMEVQKLEYKTINLKY